MSKSKPGSDGVKNKLSAHDIASASAIILATDVPLQDAERFDHVPHLKTRTRSLSGIPIVTCARRWQWKNGHAH
jgi:fructose-specific phosphotransferase system component IIB